VLLRRRWLWLIAFILLAAIAAGIVGAVRVIQYRIAGPGPLPEGRDIVIPRGGIGAVADLLAEQRVISDPMLFRLLVMTSQKEGEIRAAEFAFPAHVSLREVLHILRTARPVQHRLTIPEGLTAQQIAAIFARVETLAGDTPKLAEAALLPQTYHFERGTQRAALVARAKAALDKALTEAWERRVPNLPLASPQEALILASIVERETAEPEERPRIAAVFLNRLKRGMRLQSDPTVVYAASNGAGVLDHPLTRAELDVDSPYNTYKIVSLPPAPIAAPGLAAIQAVTQPASSDDLYFVANGTGGHAFARTLEEHNRNVARWRALGRR